MPNELLDPKIDFVFKQLFGKHPMISVAFLNAVLKWKVPLKSVELKERLTEKVDQKDQVSIITLKGTTVQDEKVTIELWLANQDDILRKNLYFVGKLWDMQTQGENNYKLLGKTVYINLLNFKYIKDTKVHHTYRLKEVDTHEQLSDMLEIHFVEIPKFDKEMMTPKQLEGKNNELEGWLQFLKYPEAHDEKQSTKEINEAYRQLQRMSKDETQRMLYQVRCKMIHDELVALQKAKKEAMQQGIQKGIQQGIQKGIQQGIQQGMIEEKKKIARNLIKAKMTDEQIIAITGLGQAEIMELRM
ncbi:MAG: Rpn family recombination-promoting nuclease/putative transposase [Cellulosilyticaceae bacterium]